MPKPDLILECGSHPANDGVCLLEAVAREAQEPHSDHPSCVCPVIAAYGRSLNDRMPYKVRQRLIPFIPRLLTSRSTKPVELKRAYLAADYAVRTFTPLALDARGLTGHATALRALKPITDRQTAEAAWAALEPAWAAERALEAALATERALKAAWAATTAWAAERALAGWAAEAARAAERAERAWAAEAARAAERAERAWAGWDKSIELMEALLNVHD